MVAENPKFIPEGYSKLDLRTTHSSSAKLSLVTLPDRYQKYLRGQEQLPQPDFDFITKLDKKYGISQRKEARQFGKDEFFAAASDLTTYAFDLRNQFDENTHDLSFDCLDPFALGLHAIVETKRQSSKRIQDLSYLFLHIPTIKSVYMQIHAEKMAAAFPKIHERLSSPDLATVNSRSDYFDDIATLMADSMINVDTLNDDQVEDLGIIMGYASSGYMRPKSLRKRDFATTGVSTFTIILERIVNGAIEDNVDIQERVRSEFLDKKGVAYHLMRTSLREAPRIGQDIDDQGLDAVRNNDYAIGACPAILKMEPIDGHQSERPIAYEYATTIVEAIPHHLL